MAQLFLAWFPIVCAKSLNVTKHSEATFIMALQAGMLVSSGCSCVTCYYLSPAETEAYTCAKQKTAADHLSQGNCAQTETVAGTVTKPFTDKTAQMTSTCSDWSLLNSFISSNVITRCVLDRKSQHCWTLLILESCRAATTDYFYILYLIN